MSNSIRNSIYKKIQFPPRGFILQKDIYTTNLLYSNNLFPLSSLKQRLPFRSESLKKIKNLNHSITIIKENESFLNNKEKSNNFYSLNNFKTKQLTKKKLKFPLIKKKAFPLTNLNLYEDINKEDIKLKNIDDDLNITSNKGKKLCIKFKKPKKISNLKKLNLPSINNHMRNNLMNSNYNISFRHRKKKNNDISMDKISLSNVVGQINKDLKDIKIFDYNRKRSFIKDKFFSTQIYVEKIMDSSNHNLSNIIINKKELNNNRNNN